MAAFKEVWQYFGATAGRWSEVFYSAGSNLAEAANFNNAFLTKRLNLLHPTNELQAIRVSQVDNPRVTTIKRVNRRGSDPLAPLVAGFATQAPGNPAEAAVVLLSSTTVAARRYWWCRGLTEIAVSRGFDGNTVLNATFATNLNTWIAAMANNGYIIHKRTPANPLDTYDYRVVKVGGNVGTGRCVITTSGPNASLVRGQRLTMQRFDPKQYPGLSGAFTMLEINGNTFTIQYVPPTAAETTPLTGTWRQLSYLDTTVINANTSAFAYLGNRSTRNFSNNSRGAKSAVRIRNLA